MKREQILSFLGDNKLKAEYFPVDLFEIESNNNFYHLEFLVE